MSTTYNLLMLGPVGTPLEEFTDAAPRDSWWEAGVRHTQVAETWTVERIGRHVYTFALDDTWTD